MVTKFTLMVSADFTGSTMLGLIRSIDQQSLPYSEFEVIFASGDAGPSSMGRLEPLAKNRPNVLLRTSESMADATWDDARGELVLILSPAVQGPTVQLAPEALERLYEYATQNRADVLFGRSVYADLSVPPSQLFMNNQSAIPPDVASHALRSPCAAVRRSFLVENAVAITNELAIVWPENLGRAAVLAEYPCLLNVEPDGSKAMNGPEELQIDQPQLTWVNAQVRMDVSAVLSGGLQEAVKDASPAAIRSSVRHLESGLDFWLPTTSEVAGSASQLAISTHADIDVLHGAVGEPLDDGVWQVMLHVPGRSAAVSAVDAAGAIVLNTLVVPCNTKFGLGLDVGSTKANVVGRMHPLDTEIRDSAKGAMFTMNLPKVHVQGSSELAGTVTLGKFRLPAQLISDGQLARVECYLSGLAGTTPISTQFGTASAAPTGLVLNILRSGIMTVERTPPARPKTAPAPPAIVDSKPKVDKPPAEKPKMKRPANVKPAPQGFVAKLRRRVPQRLEPAIKVISRSEIAKGFYRQFTKHWDP